MIRDVGYTDDLMGINADTCAVMVSVDKQSPDIAQGVDAIVAVPDDSAGICVAVQNAKDQGIPFYTIDHSPSGCEINMTVLSDNYLAGQQSGEAVVAYLTEKYGEPSGTVLEITGNMAQNVAQLRSVIEGVSGDGDGAVTLDGQLGYQWIFESLEDTSILLVLKEESETSPADLQLINESLHVFGESLQRGIEYETLFEQASTDALTGLSNRRVFKDRITSMMNFSTLRSWIRNLISATSFLMPSL